MLGWRLKVLNDARLAFICCPLLCFGFWFGIRSVCLLAMPASILAHRTATFPLYLPCSLEMSRDYPVKIKKIKKG